MTAYQYADRPPTLPKLTIAIDDNDLSITLDSWPFGTNVTANFFGLIDDEVVFVTSRSGNVLTINGTSDRGRALTAPAAHAVDAEFSIVLTRDGLIGLVETHILSGLAAARPTFGVPGRLYFATDTDGGTLYRDTGAAWEQIAPGLTTMIPESIVEQKGDLLVATANETVARLAVGAAPNGYVLTTDSAETPGMKWGEVAVDEDQITLTDVTTNNSSTTKHGFLKKLNNDATAFMDGQGNWSVPSGGGGNWTLLASATPNGAAVDFTSISGSYKHLAIVYQCRGTDNATQVFNVRFNNDSGSNYDYMRHFLNSGGFTAASDGNAVTAGEAGVAVQADLANYSHQGLITVHNYAATSFYKSYESACSYIEAASGTNMFVHRAVGWWRDTSAISRVTLTPAAGNFANGSRFDLYGLS